MADVSHAGSVITISASNTTGDVPVPLTAFPKDTDPVDIPVVTLGGLEVGTNGDVITWSSAEPKELNLSMIPNTPDHAFMQRLLQENLVEKGKISANDTITLRRVMPNGAILLCEDGKLMSGPAGLSAASSGKLKTVTYNFMFGKMSETPAVLATTGV